MLIVKNSFIAKMIGVDAIVLFPFVFFAQKAPGKGLFNHEMIHVQQIKRDGCLAFYFKYLGEYLFHRYNKKNHHDAYRSISYEIEAYNNQDQT